MADIEDKAMSLHRKMTEESSDALYSQQELQDLHSINDPVELKGIAQYLINKKLVKLVKLGGVLKFQAISQTEASKITSMSVEEAMIYSYIEASGRGGIWTKTLKAKTNLHQHIVVRCLKSLENQRYIKSIKSVKHPTRKIYMLYNLQPSIEVTGGPWFTDSELDTEFIESLLSVIWRFVASKTYPIAFQAPSSNTNIIQSTFPAAHTGFATLDAIVNFITINNITNIDLASNDIKALCDVLIYEDKLELIKHTTDTFKATWQSVLEAGYGRPYADEANKHLVSPALNKRLANLPFSVFDFYSTIEPNVNQDPDLVYIDSWVYE